MTGEAERRFLGRPASAYPGYVPDDPRDPLPPPAGERPRSGWPWLLQAATGAALIVFLGVHLVAQHLLAPGGLRDYASVVEYLRHPLALAAEVGLLGSVIAHAALGLRASLVEIVGPVALHRVSIALALVGTTAFAYGIWLTAVVISS